MSYPIDLLGRPPIRKPRERSEEAEAEAIARELAKTADREAGK